MTEAEKKTTRTESWQSFNREDVRENSAASSSNPQVSKPSSSAISPRKSGAETPSSAVQRGFSARSQVSFNSEAVSRPISMTSSQFLSHRQRSSMQFLLPLNFFQSQADIRTWGVEDLADPSIQPYDKDSPSLPKPFHVSLPGYEARLCKYVISKSSKERRERFLGPDISVFPPTWIPHWSPDPNFKPQKYGYNWEDSEAYRMDRLPYVNAEFDPVSPEATHMYNQCYPYTAYPYGVPRVA